MKIIKLVRCEFIKNFSLKKYLIVILFLCLACFGLIKMEEMFGEIGIYENKLSIDEFNNGYKKALDEYQKEDSLINKGILEIFEEIKPYYQKFAKKDEKNKEYENITKIYWQKEAFDDLIRETNSLIILKQLNENKNIKELKELDSKYDESENIYYQDDNLFSKYKTDYKSTLHRYIQQSKEKQQQELKNIEVIVPILKQSLDENAYYLYEKANRLSSLNFAYVYDVEVKPDKLFDEIYNYVIDNKVMDEKDYRNMNAIQYYRYSTSKLIKPTENDYKNGYDMFDNYKSALKFYKKIDTINKDNKKIITYAYKNELKHDVYNPSEHIEEHYFTSKEFMNQGLHLGIFIALLMSILHAGIIAKEHDKGTIKLLLTTPIKRTKILLSKFIYLILETYILWIIASIIMFLIVGIKFGFSDLFGPKLIISNGNVIKINYILWYLKEMLVCMIPLCCYLMLLLTLSTLTLNTALTASLTSIISIISTTIWALISDFKINFLLFLTYTPIPYFDFRFVRYHSKFYLQTISNTNLNNNYGIIICIITTIILFIITSLIYNKKDIKN